MALAQPVSVIIPTAGAAGRRKTLARAIDSVTSQNAVPIVVLNGDGFSPAVLSYLQSHAGIRLKHVPEPSVSKARYAGRGMVDTPYFSMLDDDDEILPDGLATCLSHFDATTDVVAANGFIDRQGQRTLAFQHFRAYPQDPAMALMREQWLSSGGAIFKTETVGPSDLANLPDILEWTFLALRLSLDRQIKLIDIPVFAKYEGHSDQVMLSPRYYREAPATLSQMMNLPLSPQLRRALTRKRAAAYHDSASRELANGRLAGAWRYHLLSMLSLPGIKYAPFTRHLILSRLWYSAPASSERQKA